MCFLVKGALGVCLATVVVGGLCGCATSRATAPVGQTVQAGDDAAFDDIAVMTEAMMLVRRYYVEEKPFRDVVYGAVQGMLSSLDPNSSFLPPHPLERFEEETRGSFEGIGVNVGVGHGGVKVIAPIEGSPAFKAGIHAGDIITAVDGKPLSGASITEAADAMRGVKGSAVKVTVERPGGEKIDLALVREEIKLPSVQGVCSLGEGIGYLRITQFNEPAAEAFAQALAVLGKSALSGLIIDLRDNPGGLLDSAVGVAEQVLPEGTEIVTVRGRDGKASQREYKAGACGSRYDRLPIAVLVNGGSASASEIVAGALKAHKRAVLVGERTYGKASVQSVIRMALRPECAVRLTTGYYYTPDGKLIHGTGIEPDVTVKVSKADWMQAKTALVRGGYPGEPDKTTPDVKDKQLERAKQVLRDARDLNKG